MSELHTPTAEWLNTLPEWENQDYTDEGLALRLHTQAKVGRQSGSQVLTAEQLTRHARRMNRARERLLHLLIGTDAALPIFATVFLQHYRAGFDVSDMVSKNHSDAGDDELASQETAKQLEARLVRLCQALLSELNTPEARESCRAALLEVHFLPNFLRHVALACLHQLKVAGVLAAEGHLALALSGQLRIMSQSRQAMVSGNLRLVTFVARQYANPNSSFGDLVQEGTVGLIKSVDRYDWRRAVRFSTYAIYWIKQTISRAMVRQEKMVRLPYNIAAKAAAVFETMNDWLVKNNRWPSIDELVQVCGLPAEEVKAIVENYQPTVSLNSAVNADEDDQPEMITMLEQNHYPQPLTELANATLRDFLRQAVNTLPAREAEIINSRFGLDNNYEMTLQDIADQMSLTRERVRQIQNSALAKLKANFSTELADFLEPG
ncbi:MAG: RNA polymerase sigma factor RpoD/SigA [Methylococcales bacterium]|nr:RNA polymerase sigma factor RpoD/SigA [Methylococcales bacterium]